MKPLTITLWKPVKHIQIGHLYEHLYGTQLAERFRDHGLFAELDYSLDASTFYAGYVRVDVTLSTKRAMDNKRLIFIEPALNDDAINGAILQIMAEKQSDVICIDDHRLFESLASLCKLPWKHNRPSHLPNAPVQGDDSFLLKKIPKKNFLVLRQKIYTSPIFDRKERQLFVILAGIIRSNLQEDIARNSFCFSASDRHFLSSNTNIYRIDRRQATTITTELATVNELCDVMKTYHFSQHLLEQIMESKKLKNIHAISTEETIAAMLRTIRVQFSLNGTRVSTKLFS